MLFYLTSVEKVTEEYKTETKTFDLPYFEDISVSPILWTPDPDDLGLITFFTNFNKLMSSTQIAVHILETNEDIIEHTKKERQQSGFERKVDKK